MKNTNFTKADVKIFRLLKNWAITIAVVSEEQKAEMLTDAKEDAEWLVRMVENLLSITRITGSTEPNIQKSPELIEEIVGDCVTKFKKRNPDVALKVNVPDTPLMVSVDAMLIEQVLMNLMDNAVHHAEGMTELCVNVTQRKRFAQVAVSDNGKVLTYDYIIKELWGPGTKGNNQSLRVHMANIRRKIEKNPAEPQYIFTEIGVGYRMVEGD